jgi:D-alanine-D-alanine ligase
MSKQVIGVLFGGVSLEHEVSVITGIQALEHLDLNRFIPVPIYLTKSGSWLSGAYVGKIEHYKNLAAIEQYGEPVELFRQGNRIGLRSRKTSLFSKPTEVLIDVMFPCLHGGGGENGAIQGLFETYAIPYVGSGILASAVGMDKIAMKQIFAQSGIPISTYRWFYRHDFTGKPLEKITELERGLAYPMFVKPANAGSSVGISKAHNSKELHNAIEVAAAYDERILVEEGFMGAREINISVIGNAGSELTTSVLEEVFPSQDLLSYADKYQTDPSAPQGMASAKRVIPAKLEVAQAEQLAELSKKAFSAIIGSGLARIDFLVKETSGEIIVIEINTLPGSLAFYLWDKTGVSFTNLTSQLIDLALARHAERAQNIVSFNSNILETFQAGSKGK